jgi:hypothetical protein
MKPKSTSKLFGIALFLALCIVNESIAQNIGVSLSPEFAYRNLVKTDFVPGIDEFIEESNSSSESIIGYTAEVFYVKPFARKMTFETGFGISRGGYNSAIANLTPESLELSGLINSDDPGFDSVEKIESQYRFTSIGVPLRLAFIAGSDRDPLRFTWSLGVTPQYMIASSSTRTFEFTSGASETLDQDFEQSPEEFNINAAVSAGVEWSINRTSALRIEPVVRYGLLPTFDSEALEVNLFSYGLSLKYFFKVGFPY